MKKTLLFGTLLLVGLIACKPKYEAPEADAGELDPSRFVMIGGSHSAGFMDDALYYDGQQASVANLISIQLSDVGGGAFYQALMNPNSVGINLQGLSRTKLGYKTDCVGVSSLSPVRLASAGDVNAWNDHLYNAAQPFGNYSIPGMAIQQVNEIGYGDALNVNYNPFFKRMAQTANSSVLGDAMSVNPTTFAMMLGIEDVLPYVKKGASSGSMTSTSDFELAYQNMLTTVTINGAKGVITTIPDVTDFPYFTTIPYNGLNLDAAKAASLNQIYNPLGYSFVVGANPFMIEDPSAGAFGVRPMQPGELLLLSIPLDSVKCNQMGSIYPFRNEFVLTLDEIAAIRTQINEYNAVIYSLAQDHSIAVADIRSKVDALTTGLVYNGITMSSKFVSGGAYSLDGIHFNPRGSAIMANEIIKALNKTYKANIKQVNAVSYGATDFP